MINVHRHLLHQPKPLLTCQSNFLPITTLYSTSFPIRSPKSTVPIHLQKPFTYGTTIKCMANPRRVKMVAKQIQRELSDMLLTDKVLQYAVLPEAALGADKYLSSLTTISDVEVSADLQVNFWLFCVYVKWVSVNFCGKLLLWKKVCVLVCVVW